MKWELLDPWTWATLLAILLSSAWGCFVQTALTPKKDERNLRGYLLGPMEGIIFMVSFAGLQFIGIAWLGFKVASKWKSWSLMADACRDFRKPVAAEEIDTQYHRFLVGTVGQVMIGLIAAAVAFRLGGRAFA